MRTTADLASHPFGGLLSLPPLADWLSEPSRGGTGPSPVNPRTHGRQSPLLASAEDGRWDAEWTEGDADTDGKAGDELAGVKRYIEENLADSFHVSDLSRLMDLTRPHFTRVFTEQEGIPPWRYVQTRRVHRARKLLDDGMSPSEVAYETGFADQSHLTRVFRRLTGTTPGRYRKGLGGGGSAGPDEGTDVQDGEAASN